MVIMKCLINKIHALTYPVHRVASTNDDPMRSRGIETHHNIQFLNE
jgi:hypothetical protein